jgi:DNA-binding CsgD family transcriptional regulator
MQSDYSSISFYDDARLLETFHRLLTTAELELRPTLNQASSLIAEVIGAEKVDVFLYEADKDSLVALGTSDTPLGRKQHALGLDRFPLANAGPLTQVFSSGESYRTGHAELDPLQLRGVVDALGVRSQLDVAVTVNGERRGLVCVVSSQPDSFSELDQRFLEAVAGWVGLLIHRSELIEQHALSAASRARKDAGDELARLTRRQQEVAACVAEGLTNEQIAERLVLVPGTVANHLAAILHRLGMISRTQIAVWAVERGLYRSDWRDE